MIVVNVQPLESEVSMQIRAVNIIGNTIMTIFFIYDWLNVQIISYGYSLHWKFRLLMFTTKKIAKYWLSKFISWN